MTDDMNDRDFFKHLFWRTYSLIVLVENTPVQKLNIRRLKMV